MQRAILKKTGIVIYIHSEVTPNMMYNSGKIVVSKQPYSKSTFCVDVQEIEICE